MRSGRHAPGTPFFKPQNKQLLVTETPYRCAQLDSVWAEGGRGVQVEPDVRKTGL